MKKFFLALLLSALAASCGAATASVEVGPSPCVYSSLGYMQCIINAASGYSVTWPAAQGNPNSLLLNDGSGNLSWSTSASFVNPMSTLGDTMFENASSNAVRLAGNITTSKEYLSQTGTGVISASPAWAVISAADIGAGTLAVARGGTNLGSGTSGGVLAFTASGVLTSSNALTQYGVLYGGGPGFTPGATASGAANQVLLGAGSSAPVWGAVPLASSAAVTGVLAASNGGTGVATVTSNAVVIGEGTAAVQTVTVNASATNEFLTQSNGTTPSFAAIQATDLPSHSATLITSGTLAVARGGTGVTSGTSGGVLSFTASGTLASSNALTANQLVIGGGAGVAPGPLAAGTLNQVLTMGASNPGWGAIQLGSSAAVTGVLLAANMTAAASGAAGTVTAENSGTFTATFTGACNSGSQTITYTKVGKLVALSMPAWNCTCSSATHFTASGGLPTFLRPTTSPHLSTIAVEDNGATGATKVGQFYVDSSGNIAVFFGMNEGNFTNVNACGPAVDTVDLHYSIQ